MYTKSKIIKILSLGALLALTSACGDTNTKGPVEKNQEIQSAKPATLSLKDYTQEDGTVIKLAAKQELVRGNGAEVASIDPQKTEGSPESHIIRDLFEGLVTQDSSGNIVPGVASSWETTDNKVFTFHLNKDAKWSNGESVTANDFVYSFQRAIDPRTASPYAWYLEMTTMLNAADIINGKKNKSELGVKAINDLTLQITLSKVTPYFVLMTAHTTLKPVNKAIVEKWGDNWTKPEHFVGNGAFVLSKWVANERIELTSNKYYWDNANTVLTKVTFLPIENQILEMNLFLSGEIDITSSLPADHYQKLKKEHPESVLVKGSLCTYYYNINTKKAPFDDVRVRKAISYAIDRPIITDVLLAQGQKPAYFLTPEIVANFDPQLPAYGEMTQEERNAKAKALLADAGFNKDHPLKFSILYNTDEDNKNMADAIASMWKKTLGIEVTLEKQEWKSYLLTKRQGDFSVARGGWCGDYNEASTFTTLLQSTNTSAGIHYKSAEYDQLVLEAQNAKTEKERTKIYYAQEALIAKDMPIIPIYQYVQTRLVNPHVGGYATKSAQDRPYSKDMYIIAE
ncbi:MAG TPA: oligopeptide ABC transporter substrate-binding protein OppA [Psychromonas hadalis]|nr:oligopeptide ABC transporter substrate-binding protein OppA [Psychromonas hadalis]